MKRDYEIGVIFNPEVNEEETRATMERLEQIVARNDGQIVKINQWGRRRLAYPIERHRDGLYIFIDAILTPETVLEIERTLKVSEIVLRYMSRRRDPKAVQKEREEREARANAAATAGTVTEEGTAPSNEEEAVTPPQSEEETVVTPEMEDEFAEAPAATDDEETIEV